ncbi:NUDIX hydrolase [Thiothrix lacustris]|uniref:NUDIX hydrolase n=1 Tax=Thiothrix lacustris TaxID=525917 RepID=UPI0027E47D42|nr:NUDIX hydrolase [Thiothrix lacustris]WMP17041.1 NUDIX hydrolase [Thiothrix lacustris]
MNYCSECGAAVSLKIPENDERMRFVCDVCGVIHYQNPKIVAGALPVWGEQVLLCRRAIAPRYGLWTLPAGFMENGETTDQAAAREAHEEANAKLRDLHLYTVISIPHINQVYMLYRCELASDDFSPGVESLETRLFHEHEIPWNELAFPSVRKTLECFFHDRKQGAFQVRNLGLLAPKPAG